MYLIVVTVCFTENIKSKEKILDATQVNLESRAIYYNIDLLLDCGSHEDPVNCLAQVIALKTLPVNQ